MKRLIQTVAAVFFYVVRVWLVRWNEVTLTSHAIMTKNVSNSTMTHGSYEEKKIDSHKVGETKKLSTQLVSTRLNLFFVLPIFAIIEIFL